MSRAVAVVSEVAAHRLEMLGPVARQAVEGLLKELEAAPRLGVLRHVWTDGQQEVYKTKLEPRAGMPGLAVAYVYLPQPPPAAAVIIAITPDDPAEEPWL
ncbi:hypothetical protein ABZX85_33100 [Streptomyces sp. NPDC004539]|uniref:hypothetical protein n=1 Tax=Streptomyces sp. NPDC004539 TaxID=3154280 RepID=UPI0033B4081E